MDSNQTCPTPTSPTFPQSETTKTVTTAIKQASPFQAKLAQMALPLAPLVQLTTGQVHPVFPLTLLNFWLLTDEQCDELAHFYHQRTPNPWSRHYPCPITWHEGLTLEEKRRKIGKFIGLQGCETPINVNAPVVVLKSAEEIEREARNARAKADDEEAMRRKLWWTR